MILKIHKKYLEKAERYGRWGYQSSFNPYAVRYIFVFPENSKYPGYAYFRDTEDIRYDQNGELILESIGAGYELRGNYYCFDTIEGEIFKIVKYKGREEGVRYKRYQLTAEEMHAAFNYGNVEIEKMDLVCAEVKEYLNNGTRSSGAVISDCFTVGRSDGTWLYLKDEKRRINSKGVRIIGNVAENKEQELCDFIKTFYDEMEKEKERLHELQSMKEKINHFEKEWEKLRDRATLLSCKNLSKEILKTCGTELKSIEKEISDIKESLSMREGSFEKTLKDKFINTK